MLQKYTMDMEMDIMRVLVGVCIRTHKITLQQ